MDKVSERAPQALVVGARGGYGQQMVQTLAAHGWGVRAFMRPVGAGAGAGVAAGRAVVGELAGGVIQTLWGDAIDAQALRHAATGVDVLVHAVNPPGYRHWDTLALPMLRASMAAAAQQGARLVMPGNVYNYAPDVPQPAAETAPQRPLTRKGLVRVQMEHALRDAAEREGLASLVMRAGDFFGGVGPSSWFNICMAKPGQPVRRIVDPHLPGVGHTWAYLPDLAEATARVLALGLREPQRLARAECLHFKGHELADGQALARCIADVVLAQGLPAPQRSAMPWWLVHALAWAVPMLSEVREMRYLWQQPLTLDNRRLLALVGPEPHTPLARAVADTLMRQGCLPAGPEGAEANKTANSAAISTSIRTPA